MGILHVLKITYLEPAVAVDGNKIAIGEPGNSNSIGRVYTANYDATNGLSNVQAFNGIADNDEFGSVLDMKDNRFVIGSANENNNGAAYTFKHNGTTWPPIQVLETTK